MPQPRKYEPGSTYKITRRCADRRYFMVPKTAMVWLWKFLLAVAAERYAIKLHVVCVLSNHWHVELTDTLGQLGEFLAFLHGELARANNSRLGRDGIMWHPGRPSIQKIPLPQDALKDAEYILMNPVVDGLTSTSAAWPGLVTLPSQVGTKQTVRRPPFFFRSGDDATMPDKAVLKFTEPEYYAQAFGPGVFAQRLQQRVNAGERKIQGEFRAHGRTFRGRRRIISTPHTDKPTTSPDKRKRGFDPEIKCTDPKVLKAEIASLKEFRKRYRRARRLWLRYRNKARAVFPHGTYAMRRFHGCLVEPPPDAERDRAGPP